MNVRPFVAERPTEYADVPPPITRKNAPANLPPGPRPRIPGDLLVRFQRDTPAFLLDLRDRYGDASSFFLGGQLFFGLFAPAMVHEVTVAQQSAFIKGVGFERMRKVLGTGLLTNEEPIHLRHRRMMQPPFHKARLDGYAEQMSILARTSVSSWRRGTTINIAPEMMRLTLLIVARTLFGTDADRHTEQIAESMEIAIDRIERTMLPGLDRLDSVPLPYWRKFREAADQLAEIAEDLIAERRRRGVDGDDLLGLLLALRDEDGSAFTDDEVRDEALTLILSGHETTANALTWAFSWLGTRPDVYEALREEALRQEWVIGSTPATVADVMGTEIAGQVVAESLRMAPPVWVAPRRALRDLDVAGVAVPAGAHVLISQYVTHRDPTYFPDPHRWEPSRWTPQLHSSLPRGAYFPFGAGTRKCLGDQFALLEARIILLHAAAQHRLLPTDSLHPIPQAEPRATYRAKGPVPMTVS
jgi:cytochrome P450